MRDAWRALRADRRIVLVAVASGVLAAVLQYALQPAVSSLDGAPLPAMVPASPGRALFGGGPALLAAVITATGTSALHRGGFARGPVRARLLQGGALLFAVGVLALALAPYTAGLTLVAFAYFCLRVEPAVATGAFPVPAFATSARLAGARPWLTATAVLMIAVALFLGALIAAASWRAPLLGGIVAQVLLQTAVAAATLAG